MTTNTPMLLSPMLSFVTRFPFARGARGFAAKLRAPNVPHIGGAAFAAAALLLTPVGTAQAQTACDADTNGDGIVDSADLGTLLSEWGPCTGCGADLDDDGQVDSADLGALLSLWGSPCNPLPWATVLEQSPDPAIVTSASLRKAISATGLPWRVRDNATNIEMVLIPPGTFQMGCLTPNQFNCGTDESPAHSVTLTNAFYLGRYEVTQAQWTARMGTNPSFFQSASAQVPAAQVPNRPVERVSWTQAQSFLAPAGLRLPTEAEWEYAYRAGTTKKYHGWPGLPEGTDNDSVLVTISWYSSNATNQTRPVGGKVPNGFGLHDMSGNVREWVNDWYSSTYYASSPSTNPPGPATGANRVLRGGSWSVFQTPGLSSSTRGSSQGSGGPGDGFRVARTP